VSPTVLRVRGFRFYFFSREELRAHVHVQHADGEAKFWIEPAVELHASYGLKPRQIAAAEKLVEEHLDEIRRAWAKHFPS
jgi:ribosomal protein L16/L10AE